ncbi:DUF3971 domain-containing protein [Chelativorans sp.]|uniref:YhdP family protein n=1 Tax=Chelativorans sp. TaxID=2203393 RepID=UPI002811CB8A|nr:DUF3971 domain-containing protein [Chelativorans sp.]
MAQEPGEYEKVRFRREDITPLESFPSARIPPPAACRGRRSRLRRWVLMPAAFLASILLLAFAGLSFVGVDAIGNERLRLQAERAIERLAGVDVDVTLGRLHLGFGKASLFALEVHDARIVRASDKAPIANAGELRFGLRAIPLLSGRVELARVAMADAELSPAQLSSGTSPSLAALIARPSAISPDELRRAIFSAIHRAFEVTEGAGLASVSLVNIGFLSGGQAVPGLFVEALEIARTGDAQIDLRGSARYRGRDLSFEGVARRNAAADAVEDLSLKISAAQETSGPRAEALVRAMGDLEISLSAREAGGTEGGFLGVDTRITGLLLGFGEDEIPLDRAAIRIAAAGADKVFSVLEARLETGRTLLNFQGTVGPEARSEGGSSAAYGIDLVSRESVLAAADSPEPPIPFGMRLAGRFDPLAMKLSAEQIEVRTADGGLTGNASLLMPTGKSPGIAVNLNVADLPTAQVKQFWPWFAAPGAREWALKNVFGGRVREGELSLNVPPGRLGNGVPLGKEEVVGRFLLTDTRFDIAGDIPPVRDGDGSVEFRGTDVDVGLSAGTIFMPDGASVQARNGTLAIHAAHLKPRIGKLEIDVAGEAPAIVRLASYRPIDLSRYYKLAPADVSGTMRGHITADIPLQADIPAKDLNWRVALDYEGLSLAKPFDGQHVTEAKGNLLIEPSRAEFSAQAKLNAVPASLHIVEPLGGAATERVRHIELKMDDASRDRLFPGLGTLVSGHFTVIYDQQPDKREKIRVKLDTARLEVPWIGWRKGQGIPATADFFLDRDGDTIQLSDFSLRGESFSLAGQVRLTGGSLEEARFTHARFNRSDDFAATIRRSGKAYSVAVSGAAFDARGVIKRVFGSGAGSGGAGGGGEAGGAVTVEASLKRVDGFNGENLAQVKFTYSSDGKRPDELTLAGATPTYGSVHVTKNSEGGGTAIRASSNNSGAVFRFLDLYDHIQGGQVTLALQGADNENLSGFIDIRDFWIADEPRLRSLVAATDNGNGQVDATRVHFERGAAGLAKSKGRLDLANGVLRGTAIGSTFQGMLYDSNNNMDITGTFMPLYGVNRIFGELPLIGQILGNGRDRGLIGITYRLSGKVGEPRLDVNPLSAIAPGFLREIFEFR